MKIKGWVLDALHLPTGTVAMRGGSQYDRVDWLDKQLVVRPAGLLWSGRVRGYIQPSITLDVMARSHSEGVVFSPVLEAACQQQLAQFYDMGGRHQQWRLLAGMTPGSPPDVLSAGVRALLAPVEPPETLQAIRLGQLGRLLLS